MYSIPWVNCVGTTCRFCYHNDTRSICQRYTTSKQKKALSTAALYLGCPIFASFRYSLWSESKQMEVLFGEYLIWFMNFYINIFASIRFNLLQNIHFETKANPKTIYLLQFALICFKMFASKANLKDEIFALICFDLLKNICFNLLRFASKY
jgi:hypothetical protein